MSEYFEGIHFANQKATPEDDALVWQQLFNDGYLTGCSVSFAGFTLTMAPGQMVIAGRQIRHAAVQNWAMSEASSGYARVVLAIDLTRIANEREFDQVNDSVEYSETLSAFPALRQQDLQSGGDVYQIVLAVVELSDSGIVRIVSQINKA